MIRARYLTIGLLASATMAASAQDLAEIQARGVLRVIAARDEQPEIFTFGEGPAPGFERELVDGFARLHKLKSEYVPASGFEERTGLLLESKGDVIVGIMVNEERRRKMDFTSEVLPARHVAVARKPNAPIDSLAALRAAKVGVLRGSSWSRAAVEAGVPSERLDEFKTAQELLDALEAGRINATVMPLVDLTLAMRRHPHLLPGVTVGPDGSAAWAARKDSPQLRAALDTYLLHAQKGGLWNRLVVKYFGEHALTVLHRRSQAAD
jgi:polar amino acid transport system substrate-binding protein